MTSGVWKVVADLGAVGVPNPVLAVSSVLGIWMQLTLDFVSLKPL